MIACPVTPLTSLIALANCTFMVVSAFCICCTVPPGFLHQPVPLPPDGPHRTDLLRRMEGISKQPIGVQLHQPLALLHIALAARQVFSPARVYQTHLETFPLQNFLQRHPIHARGLHRHRSGFHIASAILPSVADPPSMIRTPVPAAFPDPVERRQNDSHSPRQFLLHPDGLPPIPHPLRTAAVAIPCVPCGSSFRCANAQRWTSSASP